MDPVSPDIEREIERRVAAEPCGSADELLREALKALDGARESARGMLERELLRGLEGEDVEVTAGEWERIEREAALALEAKKAS